MNRTQRREMKRQVAKIAKGKGGLKHPAPDSLTLQGGPMDGWVVAPDAPALEADWWAKYIESAAEGLYLDECRKRELKEPSLWSGIPDSLRRPFRDAAKLIHGDGHYERRDGFPPTVVWIPGLT